MLVAPISVAALIAITAISWVVGKLFEAWVAGCHAKLPGRNLDRERWARQDSEMEEAFYEEHRREAYFAELRQRAFVEFEAQYNSGETK